MKRTIIIVFAFLTGCFAAVQAQHIDFVEYDLSNGLHVILQPDHSAPVVTTAVFYHVGAKDENPDRTGFAHFFEHLLFEGTENIARGEWNKIEAANGGMGNATTDWDRTYYYEKFPSNHLELALWMEAERMYHPVINQVGVDTQCEVVKEEKRMRMDNQPYGGLMDQIGKNLFKVHPYNRSLIGSMEHLNSAKLEEFQAFFKKFYVPNNAVLVVAGDLDVNQTKEWIEKYYGTIPRGADIVRKHYDEPSMSGQIDAEYQDPNIQLPMLLNIYRTPEMKNRDNYTLSLLTTVLSSGKSARLYKRMVDEEKTALEVGSFPFQLEDYGAYIIMGLPMSGKTLEDMQATFDEEVNKVCTNLISEEEYDKAQNTVEKGVIQDLSSVDGIASQLAEAYVYYGNTNSINESIKIYRSITREEIRDVARRYLKPDNRVVLHYVPADK